MDEVHAGLFQLNHDHDALDPKTRAEIPYADGARNCRSAALCHDGSLRSGLWRGRTRAGSPVFSSFQRCDPQRTSNGRGPALLLRRLCRRPGPRTFWNLCFPATARWRAVKGTGSFHGARCFPWLADSLVCGYGTVAAHDSLSILGAGLFNNGSNWVPHRLARSGGGSLFVFLRAPVFLGIAVVTFPKLFRYQRNILAHAHAQPCVLAARARGVSRNQILFRHVIPLAQPALVALLGVSSSMAFGAAIPLEALSDSPGMGQLAWQAALNRDLPLLTSITLFVTLVTVVVNFVADAAHERKPG